MVCVVLFQALEGAIAGLEVSQSESLQRLSSSLSASMSLEEDAIASTVRAEVWRSLEPVRQLPQVLTQALPRLNADTTPMLVRFVVLISVVLDNFSHHIIFIIFPIIAAAVD